MVVGRYSVQLRTSPARNNQRAAINFAAEYELGAVAQLEERVTGSDEGEGSSPFSSTPKLTSQTALVLPDKDQFDELKRSVGMDEFYAKLAQYVRLAESGEEVQVTRWGKPVARLVPPVPKPV
jgi:prevent-host-death family protein